MYLNYNLWKTFNLFLESIKDHTMMKIIIVCSLLYGIILYINKNNRKINYLILFVNMITLILIIYYYHNHLVSTVIFNYFIHNIYFYFLNSIVYLMIITFILYKHKSKLLIIHYIINIIFISFSLFITSYVHNIPLITIGNIYPMIVFGNYLYFLLYLIIIVKKIKKEQYKF